jgi:hypothetical protein
VSPIARFSDRSGPGRSELNHVPWYRAIRAITPGLPDTRVHTGRVSRVIHELQALAPGLLTKNVGSDDPGALMRDAWVFGRCS